MGDSLASMLMDEQEAAELEAQERAKAESIRKQRAELAAQEVAAQALASEARAKEMARIAELRAQLPDMSHIPDEEVMPKAFVPMGGTQLDAEIKKLRTRFGTFTKVMLVLIICSITGITGWALYSKNKRDHRMDRLEQIAQLEDTSQVVPALVEELGRNEYPDVKRRILRNLGHFADPSSVSAIVAQLQHAGPVRRDAAAALAEIGLPGAASAKDPLLAVLPSCDARDRGQVLWTLVVLGETRAADAVLEAFGRGELQTMRNFEPKRIARLVGVAKLSQPSLVNHTSSSVRQLVALTLSEVATPEAAGPLKALLEAELARPDDTRSDDVVRAAAAGLGRTGSPEAAAPLFAVLTSKPAMRTDILLALGKSTAAPQLGTLLALATEATLRRDLTKLLAETHDPRAADPLATMLGNEDLMTRAHAALGLAELGDARALGVLSELAKLRDHDDLRRKGLAALQYVASPENTRALMALVEEAPATKASVLRALGRAGDHSMASVLVREIEGPDAEPAAYSLGELNDDAAFRQVVQLAVRPTRVNMAATQDAERNSANQALIQSRRAAIIALGRYGRPAAYDTLTTIVADAGDDYELRSRAGQSLGQCATLEQIREVIEKVKAPGVPNATREYFAHALWQRPRPEINDELIGLMGSAMPDSLKMSAAVAVGYAAIPASQTRLLEMLDQPNTKRFAAVALGMMGDEMGIAELKERLKRDHDLLDLFKSVMDPEGNSAVQGNRVGIITAEMFTSGAMSRRLAAAWYLKEGDGDDVIPFVWARLATMFTFGYAGAGGLSPHDIRNALWTVISTAESREARIMAGRMLNELHERGLLLRARDTDGETEEAARFVLREIAAREARAAGAVADEEEDIEE